MAVTMQALLGFGQVYENVLGDYVERKIRVLRVDEAVRLRQDYSQKKRRPARSLLDRHSELLIASPAE
jgi:hypothetical protein